MNHLHRSKQIRKCVTAALIAAVLAFLLLFCGGCAEPAEAAEESGSQVAAGTDVPGSPEEESTAGTAVSESPDEQGAVADAGTDPAILGFSKKKKNTGGDSGNAGGGSGSGGSYNAPETRYAAFDESKAEGNDEVLVDTSSCSKGYVALHYSGSGKIKFQVVKGDATYTYSVVNGKDQIFPLQSGDGSYEFKVMENIVDKKYAELYKCSADVKMSDPMDPFLRPNQYADYSENSKCVSEAKALAKKASSQEEFINSVYQYVCSNVTYDKEKAASVKSGYLPVPDETMETKKGICFDYASLAASMLRSQGVPTKIIFGYVAPDDLYHAWNKFYTEKDGWTLVEFKVSGSKWNRIDLTFAANGADGKFIGDGSNYMEAYEY